MGLIKLDIEGSELEAIKAAKETIRKFNPILLISLYHHPKDFFEVKPLVETINPDYTFRIRKLDPFQAFEETMLIAYVEGE